MFRRVLGLFFGELISFKSGEFQMWKGLFKGGKRLKGDDYRGEKGFLKGFKALWRLMRGKVFKEEV